MSQFLDLHLILTTIQTKLFFFGNLGLGCKCNHNKNVSPWIALMRFHKIHFLRHFFGEDFCVASWLLEYLNVCLNAAVNYFSNTSAIVLTNPFTFFNFQDIWPNLLFLNKNILHEPCKSLTFKVCKCCIPKAHNLRILTVA